MYPTPEQRAPCGRYLADLRELSLLQPVEESAFASEGQAHRGQALIIRDTPHHHPHMQTVCTNYWLLLQAKELPDGEPERRIVSLGAEAEFETADFRQLLEDL